MSKVVRISPDTGPEKSGDEMIVTLRVADLKAIVRGEVQAALAAQEPPIHRIVYPLKEAAEMLSVPPTWLAAKARVGDPMRPLRALRDVCRAGSERVR
jgi:hypothetical protein